MKPTSWFALCATLPAAAVAATTVERDVTPLELFGAVQARELARTLPADQPVHFKLRLPEAAAAPAGILVFVKPGASGAFPDQWAESFDARALVWVSADGFGNDKPTAQRMLVALMAVEVARRETKTDPARTYVAGLSGGGRVASQVLTHFPRKFSGALCIVGADYHLPAEPLRSQLLPRRLVLLTGRHDFNRREIRRAARRYQDAGMQQVKLLDLPGLGHQYPDAAALDQALDLLDPR